MINGRGSTILARRSEQGLHGLVFCVVMNLGVVRMGVGEPLVLVEMSMRFAGRMFVLVMLVMNVKMYVFQRLVNMRVFMPFGDVEPDTR